VITPPKKDGKGEPAPLVDIYSAREEGRVVGGETAAAYFIKCSTIKRGLGIKFPM